MQTSIDLIGFIVVIFLAQLHRENRVVGAFWTTVEFTSSLLPAIALYAAAAWIGGLLVLLQAVFCQVLPIVTVMMALLLLVEVLLPKRPSDLGFLAQWTIFTIALAVALSNLAHAGIVTYVVLAYAAVVATLHMMQQHDPDGLNDWLERHRGFACCFLVESPAVAQPEDEESR